MPPWIEQSLKLFTPELALTVAIVGVVLAELFPRLRGTGVFGIAVLGLIGAMAAALRLYGTVGRGDGQTIFLGSFAVDGFSLFFKILFIATAMVVFLFSSPVVAAWKSGRGEFFALALSTVLGMCLMAGANDLLMMYLSLEFVSITSYILSGMLRHNRRSAEASLKYILYGAAASGLMIYGMSFLYGITGTLDIQEIGARLAGMPVKPQPFFYLVTGVLVLAGFAYKIAAAPFHMWCPDVYEGAPTPVTAFFSVGPKAAGFAMLARFFVSVFGTDASTYPIPWTLIVVVMCVLTMTLGNFAAMQQQNLKRLLAYSSIAHAGYILLAFTVFTPANLSAAMFYLVVYVIMNLGAFLGVIVLEERFKVETVDGCKGLGWRAPAMGAAMTVFLFSLTGLPPTAGFWGKLYIFSELVRTGEKLSIALVCLAAIFTVISLYYYVRILAAMFLSKPAESAPVRIGATYSVLLWVLAGTTLWLGLYPTSLLTFVREGALHFYGVR